MKKIWAPVRDSESGKWLIQQNVEIIECYNQCDIIATLKTARLRWTEALVKRIEDRTAPIAGKSRPRRTGPVWLFWTTWLFWGYRAIEWFTGVTGLGLVVIGFRVRHEQWVSERMSLCLLALWSLRGREPLIGQILPYYPISHKWVCMFFKFFTKSRSFFASAP